MPWKNLNVSILRHLRQGATLGDSCQLRDAANIQYFVHTIKKQYFGKDGYLDIITTKENLWCVRMCALFYLLENHNVLLTKANTNFYVFCHFVIQQRDIWVTEHRYLVKDKSDTISLSSELYHYNPTLKYTDSKYIANCRARRIIWRESWKTFQTFLGRLRGVRGGEGREEVAIANQRK